MHYNIIYNVTVTAILCGHRNATNFTTIRIHHSEQFGLFRLEYISNIIIIGKCDLPILRAVTVVISVNTEGPLIGGSTISYSCSTGQTASGPYTSTCMDNRHWEPDPMDIMCIGNDNYVAIIKFYILLFPHMYTIGLIHISLCTIIV